MTAGAISDPAGSRTACGSNAANPVPEFVSAVTETALATTTAVTAETAVLRMSPIGKVARFKSCGLESGPGTGVEAAGSPAGPRADRGSVSSAVVSSPAGLSCRWLEAGCSDWADKAGCCVESVWTGVEGCEESDLAGVDGCVESDLAGVDAGEELRNRDGEVREDDVGDDDDDDGAGWRSGTDGFTTRFRTGFPSEIFNGGAGSGPSCRSGKDCISAFRGPSSFRGPSDSRSLSVSRPFSGSRRVSGACKFLGPRCGPVGVDGGVIRILPLPEAASADPDVFVHPTHRQNEGAVKLFAVRDRHSGSRYGPAVCGEVSSRVFEAGAAFGVQAFGGRAFGGRTFGAKARVSPLRYRTGCLLNGSTNSTDRASNCSGRV